jgi:hypothetical protein
MKKNTALQMAIAIILVGAVFALAWVLYNDYKNFNRWSMGTKTPGDYLLSGGPFRKQATRQTNVTLCTDPSDPTMCVTGKFESVQGKTTLTLLGKDANNVDQTFLTFNAESV